MLSLLGILYVGKMDGYLQSIQLEFFVSWVMALNGVKTGDQMMTVKFPRIHDIVFRCCQSIITWLNENCSTKIMK